MNAKILLFFMVLFAAQASAAVLQGSVFEWFSLEKINNVIIDINSVPMQRIVAKNGNYSMQLPNGDYLLRAECFENNELKYETEEKISIKNDGNFTLDLIMFPASESDLNELIEPGIWDANIDFPEQLGIIADNGKKPATESFNLLVAIGTVVLLLIILLAFSFKLELGKRIEKGQEKAKTSGIETTAKIPEIKEEPLDKYAQEVLQALKSSGNRLTQKELREKVQSVGEAKISLIISELEAMGKVKKIKKGRGNIIILKE